MTEDPSKQAAAAAPEKPDQSRMVGIAVAVLFCLAVIVALVLGTGGGSSGTDPQAASTAAAAAPAAPTAPRDTYGALRRDATGACRAGQWAKCKTDLDEAARLDPAGDKVGAVQRMHAMLVEAGVE
jgi:hypothetical protein